MSFLNYKKRLNFQKKRNKIKKFKSFQDFISTKQITEIIEKLYRTNSSGVYNIGSGKGVNIKKIAEFIGKKYKKKIIFDDNKKITYLISNNKKILKKGIKFKKSFNNLDFLYK